MGIKISEAFGGNYLRAADFPKPVKWHVETVGMEKFGEDGRGEPKLVVHFREADKGLVLNKTNAQMIAQYLGDDTDLWYGKPVVLFNDESVRNPHGELTGGIRVRKPKDFGLQEAGEEVPF